MHKDVVTNDNEIVGILVAYVHLSRSIATISRIETDHVHENFACTYT